MIVCSCTGVTDRDIRQAIAWMRAADPYTLITPGKIFRALGKAADCGGCIRLFVERMRADVNLAVPVEGPADVPKELRGLRVAASVLLVEDA